MTVDGGPATKPGETRKAIDVVVVGGGQAGISLSYFLQQRGVRHVVLERDRPFSSWVNRWEGFRTNTPNWMNTLAMTKPGVFPSSDPKAFATKEELLEYLGACLEATNPPIEIASVESVRQREPGWWEVRTNHAVYDAKTVAVCSGAMSTPRLPRAASQVRSLAQLHSSQYRSPDQVTTGNVLVVGSASSGVQICRLLAESGRFAGISMAVSKVMTLPKSVLGIPTHKLLHLFRLFDVTSTSLLGRFMYSGLETKGDPIMRPAPKDLRRLFDVRLYGRFAGADQDKIHFEDGQSLSVDDLTIIWCTGFRGGYDFISVEDSKDVFDANGSPIHVRGVAAAAPGLYFVGLRYQHTVASHDLYGVGADAEYVAHQIEQRLGSRDSVSRAGP